MAHLSPRIARYRWHGGQFSLAHFIEHQTLSWKIPQLPQTYDALRRESDAIPFVNPRSRCFSYNRDESWIKYLFIAPVFNCDIVSRPITYGHVLRRGDLVCESELATSSIARIGIRKGYVQNNPQTVVYHACTNLHSDERKHLSIKRKLVYLYPLMPVG